MSLRSSRLAACLLLSALTASTPALARAAGSWSEPASLEACPGSRPQVIFPSEAPNKASGAGAIAWVAGSTCRGGEGPRVAPLGTEDTPLAARAPAGANGRDLLGGSTLTAAAAPGGRILLAAAGAAGKGQLLVQGPAAGPFAAVAGASGIAGPVLMSRAYLGDLTVAWSVPGTAGSRPGLRLRVERWFSHALGRSASAGASSHSAIGSRSVAMDFRSDQLAAWVQGSAVYAQDLPARERAGRPQRLATARGSVAVATLLSDDNRGMVAWSVTEAGSTSVYLDYSRAGVSFGVPQLLEQFADPDGRAPAAPSLIRLSSESVMLAWQGAEEGRWVARTAAIDQLGVGSPSTIARAGAEVLLGELAAGPDDDAELLLAEAPAAGAGGAPAPLRALLAARGYDEFPDRTIFAAPETVSTGPGPGPGSIAIDPHDDAAVVAWTAADGQVEYSVRRPG